MLINMITIEKIMVLSPEGKYRVIPHEKPTPLAHKKALEHFRSMLKVKYQTAEVRFEYEEDEEV